MKRDKKTIKKYCTQKAMSTQQFVFSYEDNLYTGGMFGGSSKKNNCFKLQIHDIANINIDDVKSFSFYFPQKDAINKTYDIFSKSSDYILELSDFKDSLLVICTVNTTSCFLKNYHIYRNLQPYAIIKDVHMLFMGQKDLQIDDIYFSRAEFNKDDFFPLPQKEIYWKLTNGVESILDMSNLSLLEWLKIRGLHWEDDYSKDNSIPIAELKWDSEYIADWRCNIGHHYWKESIKSRTSKAMQTEQSFCLICDELSTSWKSFSQEKKDSLLETWYTELNTYCNMLFDEEYWTEPDMLPETLTYYFTYPNGKVGDISYFIANNFGTINKIDTLKYSCTFEKEHFDKIIILYEQSRLVSWNETSDWQDIRNRPIERIVENYYVVEKIWNLYSKFLYSKNSKHPIVKNGLDSISNLENKIKHIREEFYSEIIVSGNSSGRWVNEQQLYIIIKSLYPDAIYQYRNEWLGRQSLDIYIPSIKTALEYQGRQHYESLDFFGGDEAFNQRQELDQKKRNLCNNNNIKLIEWDYRVPVTKENVENIFKE